VAIKALQRGVSPEDALQLQMEKELLERVQGHRTSSSTALASCMGADFVPASIRELAEDDFIILELCDLSLENHRAVVVPAASPHRTREARRMRRRRPMKSERLAMA
jgi:hypothetical protein